MLGTQAPVSVVDLGRDLYEQMLFIRLFADKVDSLYEENPGQLGWGAGVAAILAEEAFHNLRAPVLRVSGGNIPLPVAKELELEVSASADRVVTAVRTLLDSSLPTPVRA